MARETVEGRDWRRRYLAERQLRGGKGIRHLEDVIALAKRMEEEPDFNFVVLAASTLADDVYHRRGPRMTTKVRRGKGPR